MSDVELLIVSGPDAGRVIPLGDAPITIGRTRQNTLALPDKTLSRQHAKLVARDGQHLLVDMNSTHGTRVNGQPITRHKLRPGDEIQLGETTLRFQVIGAPMDAPAAADPTAAAATDAHAGAADASPPAEAPLPTARAAVDDDAANDADAADDGDDDGEFQLEMPDEVLPGRRFDGLTEAGEDPFGDEARATPAEAGASGSPGAATGAGAASPGPAASVPRTAPADTGRGGGRGTLYRPTRPGERPPSASLLGQELDQRSAGVRWTAILVAIGLALAIGYGVMRLVSSGGVTDEVERDPLGDPVTQGPNRPTRAPSR